MTSVTETEHGVPDAGRTEVATKMNSWPCVCGRIPPQTWWLFPIYKQEAPVWKGLPDPTFCSSIFQCSESWVGIISCPFLFCRQQCVPPRSFRELTLDVGPGENSAHWEERCGGAEGRSPKTSFPPGVESAHFDFPRASVWLLANASPG